MTRILRILTVVSLVGGAVSLSSTPSIAAPFTVTRTDDPPPDGCAPADCSLREAIVAANSDPDPDTITLPAGTYTLSIPQDISPDDGLNGDLDVFSVLTITGAGAQATIIDGGDVDRLFDHLGTSLTISGITLRNGRTAALNGGGAIFASGNVTLEQVAVTGSEATNGRGGGIAVEGSTLTIRESALTSNATSGSSGNGGALSVSSNASASLTNVTISGNAANGDGGGISNQSNATTSLINVTVNGNTADADDAPSPGGGGGVAQSSGTLSLLNTIVAGNVDASSATTDPDCFGTLSSLGYNLIQSVTAGCGFTTTNGDLVNQGPGLGPLADNGGPTMTHALLSGSPAIDAGGPGGPSTDQRGVSRNPDIGAYELASCGGAVVNIVGTAGNDTLTGTTNPDGILALDGDDTVDAKEGDDGVCAGDGNDTINGATGNDTLLGEGGDDVLTGASGNDVLDGGPGMDRLVESGDVDFTLTDTSLTSVGIGNPSSDSLVSIERATLSGGASANDIDASGFSGAVIAAAGEGDDGLLGAAGNDVLDGGPGLDTLFDFGNVSFTLNNTSLVGVGTDAISSIEAAVLIGGPGNNVINTTGFTGSTLVQSDRGRDRVLGGSGPDLFFGGPGNDYLSGGKGPDILAGGRDRDRLFGGAAKDRLSGGRGQDRLSGGSGKDRLSGNQGPDICRGTIGTDTFRSCELIRAA